MKSELSYRIDAVIILLDMRPPWVVAAVLRWYLRQLARDIPNE